MKGPFKPDEGTSIEPSIPWIVETRKPETQNRTPQSPKPKTHHKPQTLNTKPPNPKP